jgi:transcriptional regulator with XRE-family HTH domain
MTRQRKKHTILTPGEVVRELRTKKEWTQTVLSEITGIAITNLSNIETGRSQLGEERAILLAEAFGVKPQFILFPNGFERPKLKAKLEAIRKRLKMIEKPA